MKNLMICCLTLTILITGVQAEHYRSTAGPWSLDFSSTKKFSTEIVSDERTDYNLWLVILKEANGNGSVSFSLFSYSEPKSVDIYLEALLDAYIKLNNMTSVNKGSILIGGKNGIQADGFKYGENWNIAAWSYAPYRDPNSGTNLTDNIIILQSNLLPGEFRQLAESLNLSKGYWFNPKPWLIEFNCSQELKAEIELEDIGYVLYLYDREGHRVAWISTYKFNRITEVNNQYLDGMLDILASNYQVTSPTKKSIIVDGTQGRMAEGYSSFYGRKWRGFFYPLGAKYDSFTGKNSTKYFIEFDSLQDLDQFNEIANSIHVNSEEIANSQDY
jgi:hypothetical protein